MIIAERRKPYHGMNGILTHYHILCDHYMGFGRYTIRILPCDCIELIDDMNLQWDSYILPKDQPIYYSVI